MVSVTEELVNKFAVLTGDYNPLHMSEDFASQTVFGSRVAHGMIAGSFVSTLIGMHLPGPGALWLSQDFKFLAPVRIGDQLKLLAQVSAKSEMQGIVTLDVSAMNQAGILVLKGKGEVKLMTETPKQNIKPLNQCRVLVTGTSRGLGAAIAQEFGSQGSDVWINYRNSQKEAEGVASSINSKGGKAHLVQADITTDEGVESLLKKLSDQSVDILILNAVDHFKQAPLLELSQEDFEKGLDYGLRAPLKLLRGVLPKMVEAKFGRIVSVLSVASFGAPPAGFAAYNVNKKALEAITRSIAVEYGRYNICANMISPNMLRTDLTSNTSERAKQLVEAQTPLKRLASLNEVAANAVFLCRPEASYINGHNLVISGGSLMV